MFLPSQLDGRATYTTQGKDPVIAIAGFEAVAKIYTLPCFIFVFSAAMHENVPNGSYILLLDQNATPASQDLALITLGPTTAAGQVLPLPEEATTPEIERWVCASDYDPKHVRDAGGRWRRMRGLPFDFQPWAVLSSTPGRFTPINPAAGIGARITARLQTCG